MLLVNSACIPQSEELVGTSPENEDPAEINDGLTEMYFNQRPIYKPGEIVDYVAQTGDTLPALAARFNTTEEEIRSANPVIPDIVTTLPPTLPLKIPIYYQPLWGSTYQILPDFLFVNGPAQIGFEADEYVNSQPGGLKSYSEYVGGKQRSGGEVVEYVAQNFSISPKLLLAIIEYHTGLLSTQNPSILSNKYLLGHSSIYHQGLYLQLVWAANQLNNGYYGWRTGRLTEFEHLDGSLERPDPWQNAGSVALQYYFSKILGQDEYLGAILQDGISYTYQNLFGEFVDSPRPLIPGSLEQPPLSLPFMAGSAWAYTGGPHSGWGDGDPLAAIDFAPPAMKGGCVETAEFATAVSDGIIVRKGTAIAVLDLDGDHEERTGWSIFYLHLASDSIPEEGTSLRMGDPIGHPSCEGGRSTGTHVHIARKYNGEWIPADGPLAFNLEGWEAQNGSAIYEGNLVRFGQIVRACVCSDHASQIIAQPR